MMNTRIAIGAQVRIRKPRLIPMFLARLLDERVGCTGNVVSIDLGENTRQPVYGVAFEPDGRRKGVDAYFGDQFDRPTTPDHVER